MDILFKKVFNNIYIFKNIIRYLKYEDIIYEKENWDSIKDYEIYEEVTKRYDNRFNISLKLILERKQYKTFDRVIECYFKYAIIDPIKYWYYVITPKADEFIEVLKYPGLGYQRFLQIYNEFEQTFNRIHHIAKISIMGGNIEITNYLKNKRNLNGRKEKDGEIIKIKRFMNENQNKLFICGGSPTMFKHLYYDIFKVEHRGRFYTGAERLIPFFQKRNEKQLYPILLPFLPFSQIKDTIMLSIVNLDFELANELIKNTKPKLGITRYNFLLSIQDHLIITKKNDEYYNEEEDLIKLIELYFKSLVFNSDKETYETNAIRLYSKKVDDISTTFIYGYDFSVINSSDDALLKKLLSAKYIPNSVQEFKYIISKQDLIYHMLSFGCNVKSIYHITTILKDLEYMECYYEFFKSRQDIDALIKGTYYNCINSTFEIANWAINKFKNDKSIKIPTVVGFEFTNAFFNDIKTLELVNPPLETHQHIIEKSIKLGYFEVYETLFKRFLQTCKLSNIQLIKTINNYLLLAINKNQFKIFKSMIDLIVKYVPNLNRKQLLFNEFLNSCKQRSGKYLHYSIYKLVLVHQIPIEYSELQLNDNLLISLFIKDSNQENKIRIFEDSIEDSIKVNDYKKLQLLIEPSNNNNQIQLSSLSIRKNILISLLNDGFKFLFYCFKLDLKFFLDNLNLVITDSIFKKRIYYIDFILNNYENDGFDKIKFFTKFIYASLVYKYSTRIKKSNPKYGHNQLGKSIINSYRNENHQLILRNYKQKINLDYFKSLVSKRKFNCYQHLYISTFINLPSDDLNYLEKVGLPLNLLSNIFGFSI